MDGSAESTEWETDSDQDPSESESQSLNASKPSTPLPRVDTLRALSSAAGTSNAKSQPAPQKNKAQNIESLPQRRPQKPTRASRPPSSLSTKSSSSVHLLLGLHPHTPTSTSTTSTTPPINIISHILPPLTATLSQHSSHHRQDSHEDSQLTPIPIPPSPSLSRLRTTSTLSSPASSAISSLSRIPTRPPSPYAPYPSHLPHHSYSAYSAYPSASSTPPNTSNLISFFPPSNPFLSLESIHPLLPSPFLGNHLTVLAKRAPIRESLERVRSAKAKADAAGGR